MFKVEQLEKTDLALTNKIYLNHNSGFKKDDYVIINNEYIYGIDFDDSIKDKGIKLSKIQRINLDVAINQNVNVEKYEINKNDLLTSNFIMKVNFMLKNVNFITSSSELKNVIIKNFNNQMFKNGQYFVVSINKVLLKIQIKDIEIINESGEIKNIDKGIIHDKINILVVKDELATSLTIEGAEHETLFNKDFKPEKLGIGGLDKEFTDILRRAFMSRMFPPKIIKKIGINHVRGIILYGPPGCGKTLLARQIGKMVSSVPPKIVNGPEILNKFVGESEQNIRNLFIDAENDYKIKGDNSPLHIIILDEIDAICKQRGTKSDSTGVNDTIVNQLLSKIDGVDSLNNILLIGMTNRLDLIDEALLRPGRFEIQIEIKLPDENGRIQILNIHTKTMRESKILNDDVNILDLAKLTKNYSGADIEGLIKSASSFALSDNFDLDLNKVLNDDIIISKCHFDKALKEIKPSFGIDEENLILPHKLIKFEHQELIINEINEVVNKFLNNDNLNKLKILVNGEHSTGKCVAIIKTILNLNFGYSKILSSDLLIGKSEIKIINTFMNAYKTPEAIIYIKNIEEIIEYTQSGPRFNNTILHLLISLIKKNVFKNKLIIIVSSTLSTDELEILGLYHLFETIINVENINIEKLLIK